MEIGCGDLDGFQKGPEGVGERVGGETRAFQDDGHYLLGQDVVRRAGGAGGFDFAVLPHVEDRGRAKQAIIGDGQKEHVAGRAGAAARAAHALQEGRHGVGGVDLDHSIQAADVDAELQGARGDDHAGTALGEGPFGLAALVGAE